MAVPATIRRGPPRCHFGRAGRGPDHVRDGTATALPAPRCPAAATAASDQRPSRRPRRPGARPRVGSPSARPGSGCWSVPSPRGPASALGERGAAGCWTCAPCTGSSDLHADRGHVAPRACRPSRVPRQSSPLKSTSKRTRLHTLELVAGVVDDDLVDQVERGGRPPAARRAARPGTCALAAYRRLVGHHAHDQPVALLAGAQQDVQVADVEHVPGAGHVADHRAPHSSRHQPPGAGLGVQRVDVAVPLAQRPARGSRRCRGPAACRPRRRPAAPRAAGRLSDEHAVVRGDLQQRPQGRPATLGRRGQLVPGTVHAGQLVVEQHAEEEHHGHDREDSSARTTSRGAGGRTGRPPIRTARCRLRVLRRVDHVIEPLPRRAAAAAQPGQLAVGGVERVAEHEQQGHDQAGPPGRAHGRDQGDPDEGEAGADRRSPGSGSAPPGTPPPRAPGRAVGSRRASRPGRRRWSSARCAAGRRPRRSRSAGRRWCSRGDRFRSRGPQRPAQRDAGGHPLRDDRHRVGQDPGGPARPSRTAPRPRPPADG